MQRFINSHFHPVSYEIGRGGETCGTGTDDRCLAQLVLDLRRFGLRGACSIPNEALKTPDRYGFVLTILCNDALRFALCLLRANAATDRRENTGFIDRLQRRIDITQ